MKEVRSFILSKTILGAAIAIAPPVINLLGYSITGADVAQATGLVDSVVTAVGGLLAVFGRVTATKAIGR